MVLVSEDRQGVADQRHVVRRAHAHLFHGARVLLRVARCSVAQAERGNTRTLVHYLLRFVERFTHIGQRMHAGRSRGIAADRHAAGDALHCLHLPSRGRQSLLTLGHGFQLASLRLHRRRCRRDVRAQLALMLR
nr:hypothetical protein [Burkholderia ambifaria]